MQRAIAAVEREGGAASLAVVGRYIHDTFVEGAKILARIDGIKIKGREAFKAIDRLARELEHLRHRQQSGATGLGPEIDAREAEMSRARREFDEAKQNTNTLAKLYEQLEQNRESSARACTTILARLPAAQTDEGIRGLRSALEVSSPGESLLLVRILRLSKRAECCAALLEIVSHPQSPAPTRVEAACAVAALGDRDSLRSLLARIDGKDEVATKRVLHSLSRRARRKLDTLDDANKWLASESDD